MNELGMSAMVVPTKKATSKQTPLGEHQNDQFGAENNFAGDWRMWEAWEDIRSRSTVSGDIDKSGDSTIWPSYLHERLKKTGQTDGRTTFKTLNLWI